MHRFHLSRESLLTLLKSMSRFVTVSVTNFCKKFLGDVARRCSSSFSAVRLVLIAPLICWQNSTPFWCKASLCTIKIENFRTYHGQSLFNLSRSCSWQKNKLTFICLKNWIILCDKISHKKLNFWYCLKLLSRPLLLWLYGWKKFGHFELIPPFLFSCL